MKKLIALCMCLFALLCVQSVFAQDTLTNKEVVAMSKGGLNKDLIVQTINESPCNFNTEVQTLINLKKMGLHDDVLAAMKNRYKKDVPTGTTRSVDVKETTTDPLIAKIKEMGPGIYYQLPDGSLGSLETTVFSGFKQKGLAAVAVSGIFNSKYVGTLNTDKANTQISNQKPIFYFYFEDDKSPNEYVMFKFNTTKRSREIILGKENNVSSSLGVDEKNRVKLSYTKIVRGLYECTFETFLSPGEYGIMHGNLQEYEKKVYDFSIAPNSTASKPH